MDPAKKKSLWASMKAKLVSDSKKPRKKTSEGVSTKSMSKHWILGDFSDFKFDCNELPNMYDILKCYYYKKSMANKNYYKESEKIMFLQEIYEEIISIWNRSNIPTVDKCTILKRLKNQAFNFEKIDHNDCYYHENDSDYIDKIIKSKKELFDISKCKCFSKVVYEKNSNIQLFEPISKYVQEKKLTLKVQKCIIETKNIPVQIIECDCEYYNRMGKVGEIRLYLSGKCGLDKLNSSIIGAGIIRDKNLQKNLNIAAKVASTKKPKVSESDTISSKLLSLSTRKKIDFGSNDNEEGGCPNS